MRMQKQDMGRFFSSLVAMSTHFSDDMSPERQQLYWELLKDELSIAEWEYGCTQAMKHETFHKVPLPAVLIAYAQPYREEQHRRALAHYERQRQLNAASERSRDSSFSGTEQERRDAAALDYAKVRAALEAKWNSEVDRLTGRDTSYRKRSPEELQYVPQTNTEIARAEALRLLTKIRAEVANQEDHDGPLH